MEHPELNNIVRHVQMLQRRRNVSRRLHCLALGEMVQVAYTLKELAPLHPLQNEDQLWAGLGLAWEFELVAVDLSKLLQNVWTNFSNFQNYSFTTSCNWTTFGWSWTIAWISISLLALGLSRTSFNAYVTPVDRFVAERTAPFMPWPSRSPQSTRYSSETDSDEMSIFFSSSQKSIFFFLGSENQKRKRDTIMSRPLKGAGCGWKWNTTWAISIFSIFIYFQFF